MIDSPAMRLFSTRRALLLVVGAPLCGCVSTTGVVRNRFATEQRCPSSEVTVDQESGTRYRARGCEKETLYVCTAPATIRGGDGCVEEGLPSPGWYREPEHPAMAPPDPRLQPPQ